MTPEKAEKPPRPDHMTGGCMCGAVRYAIGSGPLGTALCHCDRCRTQSGSAFSTVMYVPRSSIRIEGETAHFADIGASGLAVRRIYCPKCGSPLFTDMELTPELMFVKVGAADDNQWFVPRHRNVRYPAASMVRARSGRCSISWQSLHLNVEQRFQFDFVRLANVKRPTTNGFSPPLLCDAHSHPCRP